MSSFNEASGLVLHFTENELLHWCFIKIKSHFSLKRLEERMSGRKIAFYLAKIYIFSTSLAHPAPCQ